MLLETENGIDNEDSVSGSVSIFSSRLNRIIIKQELRIRLKEYSMNKILLVSELEVHTGAEDLVGSQLMVTGFQINHVGLVP